MMWKNINDVLRNNFYVWKWLFYECDNEVKLILGIMVLWVVFVFFEC